MTRLGWVIFCLKMNLLSLKIMFVIETGYIPSLII